MRLCQQREKGRVVKVDVEVVYGTDASTRGIFRFSKDWQMHEAMTWCHDDNFRF